MAKKIQITKGQFAIVDDEDYEELMQWKWSFSHGYAVRGFRVNKRNRLVSMHAQILNPPQGMQIDHINSNKLDNRRCNLRICTNLENSRNRGKNKNNSSGYKGVYFNEERNIHQVYITIDGKHKYIGKYKTPEEAAIAYDHEARKNFGEFAGLNFGVL